MFSKLVLCSLLAFSLALPQEPTIGYFTNDIYKILRVIGGTKAARGEFPHQVSLQLGSAPYVPYQHICGGSIIGQRWIVTAAHCVYTTPPGMQLIVRAGKSMVKFRETTDQSSNVEDVFVHEGYRGNVSPNDIALIKLSTALIYNEYVRPIKLPVANSLPTGDTVLSGWGSTSRTTIPSLPNSLQKVTLPIIDLETCRHALRGLGDNGEVHDTNVCTGPLTGGYSACNGDSGGPLIKDNRDKDQRELVGIVSWGLVPCGGYGAPAVFVRVSAFIDWIMNKTAQNGGL